MTDDPKRKRTTSRSSRPTEPKAKTPIDQPESGEVDFGKFVSDMSRKWTTPASPKIDKESIASVGRASDPPGGGGTPPAPPEPASETPPPNRNVIVLALLGLLAIVASFLVVNNQLSDSPEPSPTPEPTALVTEVPLPTTVVILPTPTIEVLPTNTIGPTAEPTLDINQSTIANQCTASCLVRIGISDSALAIMRETGDRASHSSGDWLWAIASRETIGTLDLSGEDVIFLQDSSDTLNLYVATLPEGQTDFSVINWFGDFLDSVDRTAIVTVPQIPVNVKATAEAGIDITKFAPGFTPLVSETEGETKPILEESDIYGLSEDVSADEVLKTVTDLQGTSSTDGTGIGTRQYLQPGNVMAAEYLFRELESYGLTVHYEDFISPEFTLASNIVAEIPGRDRSAIYGVMAHFDSIAESFSVAPGADDNATGVAASLEIARILGQYDLKHPVHIIFMNAEETGIVGSRFFAKNALDNQVPYEGIFNVDAIGSNRMGSLIWLNSDSNSEWMMSLIIRINNAYGLGQDIQARINPEIVADDNRLREQGFESILVARELFGTSPYHHTSNDILTNVSIGNTVTATQLILLTIASLVVP